MIEQVKEKIRKTGDLTISKKISEECVLERIRAIYSLKNYIIHLFESFLMYKFEIPKTSEHIKIISSAYQKISEL